MGSRKKQMAETIKANRMNIAFAKLNNCPTFTKENEVSCRFSTW